MCVVSILVGWEIEPCLLWRKLLESHEPERPEYFFCFSWFLVVVFSTSRWRLPEWNDLALGLLPSLRERGRATSRTIALWRAHRFYRWVKTPKASFLMRAPFWESWNTSTGWDSAVLLVFWLISSSPRSMLDPCPDCTMTDQSVLLWCFAGFTLLWQDHNIAGSVPRKWWAPFRAWKLKLKTLL